MQFEEFDTPGSVPEPRSIPSEAAPVVRFRKIVVAVEAALKGDWSMPLPLDGNDQLSALANDLHSLFEKMCPRAGSANGLTPQVATEAELQQKLIKQNARLEYLIANTPAIIYSSVPSGDFKMNFVSDNAVHVLGYKPEEMLSDPNFWFDHIHPDDVPTIFSSLALVFVEGQRTYDYRFRCSNGQYLWMHDTLRLIRDEDDNPLEVIGSLTDITDQKVMEEALKKKGNEQQSLIEKLQQAQAQLLQSEKMASIGQLAAGIAHEINNPVGFVNSNMGSLHNYMETLFKVIEGYDQALTSAALSAEVADTLKQLKTEADLDYLKVDVTDLVKESMDGLKRVKDIVQSLKDFSHVGEADWQLADLHQGLDSTLNIANNEFKYKATVEKHYGNLPQVTCLASQLNQVFMNLIVNASHAIKEAGVITIRTGVVNDWVWIEIADNGAGIVEENLTRIFEPFFTTKPIGQGTGLGLSLSYNIIKKHGGRIEVTSALGKGTAFTIHLPVTPKITA